MMRTLVFVTSFTLLACSCTSTTQNTESTTLNQSAFEAQHQIDFIPGQGVLIQNALKVSATVIAINKKYRMMKIKNIEDETFKFKVPQVVKNFDQIEVGDAVVVELFNALAMQLAAPGEEIEKSHTTLMASADPGMKPALVEFELNEVLAEISAVDRKSRRVTVTGPKGNSVWLIVPEHIEKFDALKIGDKVNTAYAQAFAISVQKLN